MKILQRYTAIGGILFLVFSIVAIGMTASTGLTEQALEMGDIQNVLPIIAGHLGTVVAAMWLFNLANIFMAVFGIGLAALLDETHPWIRFASLLVVLSVAGFLLETTMTIGFAQGLAPAYASASGTEKAALAASALALIYFRDATALLASVMVAVTGLLFGLAVLRVQGWPRWIGWLVLISGVLGLLGGFYPFVAALSFVRAISHLLFAFWAMVVGIKLLHADSVLKWYAGQRANKAYSGQVAKSRERKRYMSSPESEQKLYKPNFVHSLFEWLDRLPLPAWVSVLILFPVVGLVQHLVAYGRGFLALGEFNFDLGTAGYWLVGSPLLFIWAMKGGRQAWEDIKPLVNPDHQEKFDRMYYEFYTIPRWQGTAAFFLGALAGLGNGFADMAVAPAVDYAFAELRLSIWALGVAFGFVVFYQLIRQLNIIRNLYTRVAEVDIFNRQLLYGFPKYTATFGIAIFFYLYLAPLVLDPTAFATGATYVTTVMLSPLILVMFFLPLAGMHNRLLNEKEALKVEVGNRTRMILRDIHRAAFDEKNFEDMSSIIAVHTVLLKEKETIEDLSTWPWRPGTLNGLLSAILLPAVLSILRDVISGWIEL